jgi:hypothetical protein
MRVERQEASRRSCSMPCSLQTRHRDRNLVALSEQLIAREGNPFCLVASRFLSPTFMQLARPTAGEKISGDDHNSTLIHGDWAKDWRRT